MRINHSLSNTNFKGYAAAPLKAVYIEKSTSSPIDEEMRQIAKKENFELRYAYDFSRWTQDDKTIIEDNGKPVIVGNLRVDVADLSLKSSGPVI